MYKFKQVSFKRSGSLLLPSRAPALGHQGKARAKDGEPQLDRVWVPDGQGVAVPIWAAYLWHHLLEKEMNIFKPLLTLGFLSFGAKTILINVKIYC